MVASGCYIMAVLASESQIYHQSFRRVDRGRHESKQKRYYSCMGAFILADQCVVLLDYGVDEFHIKPSATVEPGRQTYGVGSNLHKS